MASTAGIISSTDQLYDYNLLNEYVEQSSRGSIGWQIEQCWSRDNRFLPVYALWWTRCDMVSILSILAGIMCTFHRDHCQETNSLTLSKISQKWSLILIFTSCMWRTLSIGIHKLTKDCRPDNDRPMGSKTHRVNDISSTELIDLQMASI